MQQTSNLKLKKPEGTDVINIQDLNDNADILDKAISKINQRHKVCEDNGTTIQISEQDLNTITKTGFYTGKKMVNGPASWGEVWMYIEVVALSPTNVLQKAYNLFHNTTFYIRRKPYESTDWTAWEAYAMDKDVEALRKTVAEVKAASFPLTGGTVKGPLQTTGHLTCGGFDFNLGTVDQATRGDSGPSRAMAKLIGNVLAVNYAGDFKGGIQLQGPKTQVDGTLMVGGKDVAKELAAIGQRHKVCADNGWTIDLPAGTDLNTLIKTGFYTGEKTVNGPPSLGAIWMYIEVVAGSSTNVLQKAYGLFSSTTCYIRRKPKGSLDWTAWIAMATEKDIAEVKQLAIEGKTKAEKDIQTLGQKVSEAKEHANTAAKQAETNAKAHTDTKLAEVKQRHKVCADNGDAIYYDKKDVNTLTGTGFYAIANPINAPALVSNIAYMVVIRYSSASVLQKLYDYGADKAYIRRFTGTWQPWIAMATEKDIAEVDKKLAEVKQSGVELKKKLADVLSVKGVKVSASEEFSTLINLAGRMALGGGHIEIDNHYWGSEGKEHIIAVLPPKVTFARFTPNDVRERYFVRESYIGVSKRWTTNWRYDSGTDVERLWPEGSLSWVDSKGNKRDIAKAPPFSSMISDEDYDSAKRYLLGFEISPRLYPGFNFDEEIKLVAYLSSYNKLGLDYAYSDVEIHGTITYY